jgi:predicted ArsR family transcriptional regulator
MTMPSRADAVEAASDDALLACSASSTTSAAPKQRGDGAGALRDALAALGFEPSLERDESGFSCRLGNCPYRDSVRQNQAIVCGLHRGVTEGMLAELDSKARLTRFEPGDPDRAGCLVEVATGGAQSAD